VERCWSASRDKSFKITSEELSGKKSVVKIATSQEEHKGNRTCKKIIFNLVEVKGNQI